MRSLSSLENSFTALRKGFTMATGSVAVAAARSPRHDGAFEKPLAAGAGFTGSTFAFLAHNSQLKKLLENAGQRALLVGEEAAAVDLAGTSQRWTLGGPGRGG